ncbi:MAG: hypothetical protein V4696_03550 [Pseudomonadota bacterium]
MHASDHNMAWLTPDERAKYEIDAALEGPTERWTALALSIDKAPAKISSVDEAEKFTTLVAQLQACRERVNNAHRDSKEPWLSAGRVVDGVAGALRDKIGDAIADLSARLTDWQVSEQKRIELERAAVRAAEIEDPEPGWQRPQDTSRRASRVRSVEGASAHLTSVVDIEIVDFRAIPDRYFTRPKVLAALRAEILPDVRKGDAVPGVKKIEQAQSRVKA